MSWKAKLIVFTICIYFTSASYTMIVPFLPLYLLELGANQNNIEFWTAVIFSVSFLVGGVMAPLWGKLADKKGRNCRLAAAAFRHAYPSRFCQRLSAVNFVTRVLFLPV